MNDVSLTRSIQFSKLLHFPVVANVIFLKQLCSYLDMNTLEFNLGEVLEAVKVQAMDLATEKEIQLEYNLQKEVSSMFLYGDNLRLQQVLSDFLITTVKFAPAGGSVVLSVVPRMERIGTSMHIVHLEFRYVPFLDHCRLFMQQFVGNDDVRQYDQCQL